MEMEIQHFRESEMEIQHLSHEHPLILISEENDDDGEEIVCNLCTQKITTGSSFSSYYRCRSCPFFNLHKLCAKLPTEIKHPLHPEVTLTLLYDNFFGSRCESCDKYVRGFAYVQRPTEDPEVAEMDYFPMYPKKKYVLDIQCAAKTMSFKHEFHKHPLTPMLCSALFECHACRTQHKKGMSFVCNTCGFWIHEDCALLPTTFTHRGHVHPLILGRCNYYTCTNCNVCKKGLGQVDIDKNIIVREERLVQDLWVYQCATCKYYVHVNCTTKIKEREREMEIQHFRGSEMEIQHLSHEHPLILIRVEKDDDFVVNVCYLCRQKITTGSSSSYYRCNRWCSFFYLHKLCAKLPTKIKHPVHPEVTLTLRYNDFFGLRCESCDKYVPEFAYFQRPTEDPEGPEMDDEFLFGSAYFQRPTSYSPTPAITCADPEGAEMDDESLSGSEYYPDESLSGYYPQYALDIQCAAKTMSFKHKLHKHPLTPVLRSVLLECHACGTQHKKGMSFMCNTCGFWIHEDCALLPTTFTHTGHVHPLILCCYYDNYYKKDIHCNVCEKILVQDDIDERLVQDDIDEDFIFREERLVLGLWVYQCATCKYYVHVNCSTKTRFRNSKTVIKPEDLDVTNLIHLPHDGSVNLIDQFMKQISLGLAKEELNHFSHNHPLILFDDAYSDDQLCSSGSELSIPIPNNEQNNEKICNACVRPILGPFYSCRSHNNLCNFFLHKWCAELPKEIQHPFHEHPLSLMRMSDPKRRVADTTVLYNCKCCGKISNGLGFICTHNECKESLWNFYGLDVKCASLLRSIVHELHEHPLHLSPNCVTQGCCACDELRKVFAYRCNLCSFSLHYDCALLPRTIKHRYDEHPFTLTYGPIQDGPEEYICEFCEKDIDPKKRWFYHCIDCDQSACTRCIYYKEENEHSNIKFRENKNCNRHAFTKVFLENNCLCDYCHKDFHKDFFSKMLRAYTCANCKTILHRECMLL